MHHNKRWADCKPQIWSHQGGVEKPLALANYLLTSLSYIIIIIIIIIMVVTVFF